MKALSFTMKPLPPFSLELTVWALRRRPHNEVDRWDGGIYSRIFIIDGVSAKITLAQQGDHKSPKLDVAVYGKISNPDTLKSVIPPTLDRMFSLKKDLSGFYSLARADKKLGPLARKFSGMKPPRFPTVYEALVNAFACQQISLDLGILLLNRLSHAYGVAFREGESSYHAFPRPEDLAVLSPEDFRELGFSRNKGRAIIELSQGLLNRNPDLERLPEMSDDEAFEYLLKIRGVGRWSAEYALLRGMGRTNIFPGDDVGAQKNLQNFMGLAERPDYEQIKKVTSRWQPYSGFVYFHLLLSRLREKGYLT